MRKSNKALIFIACHCVFNVCLSSQPYANESTLIENKIATQENKQQEYLRQICSHIANYSNEAGLPPAFLARLIWKESRFDAQAVSPAGAEGIAQFMPGTAKMRGLDDAFDPQQAIHASAKYLSEMHARYGNLGLAAVGYNAGETRLARWLNRGGFLPIETEDYVLSILGEPADNFTKRSHQGVIKPLDEALDFQAACQKMPVIAAKVGAMARKHQLPWGVQVAGNFRRSAALRQWRRVRARNAKIIGQYKPVISRVRTPRGRRGVYAVRIGAQTRGEARKICRRLRSTGAACIIRRNR